MNRSKHRGLDGVLKRRQIIEWQICKTFSPFDILPRPNLKLAIYIHHGRRVASFFRVALGSPGTFAAQSTNARCRRSGPFALHSANWKRAQRSCHSQYSGTFGPGERLQSGRFVAQTSPGGRESVGGRVIVKTKIVGNFAMKSMRVFYERGANVLPSRHRQRIRKRN